MKYFQPKIILKRTNPNEVFPAKYADEEEDRRDEPG